MNENGRESVERTHQEAVERYREQKQKGCELVETMFREALDQERERAPVEQMHGEAVEQASSQPLPGQEAPTIPYTELPPPQPDSQLFQEWNFYRREVGRLLAEGQEGRFVLIKGEDLIGIWDTQEEAEAVALQKYLMQPCLIHRVRSREPLLRVSTRLWRWPSSFSRFSRTACSWMS